MRTDKTQQNSKCSLCGDREETLNQIRNKCRKLAKKEGRTRYDWVGRVIQWKIFKKLKFEHTNKWYIHNPASLLENDTHKLLAGKTRFFSLGEATSLEEGNL